MPTAHRERGFNFVIYTNDHLPMHVHAVHGGDVALFNLGSIAWQKDESGEEQWVVTEKPQLRENRGMKPAEVRRALAIVVEQQIQLIARWHEIHG